jgi:hypothetical protein
MQLRQVVFRVYGDRCHLCGHGGARQVDHLIPVSVRPDLGWELSNLRPVHGAPYNYCPVCRRACNQSRSNRTVEDARARAAMPKGRRRRQPAPVKPSTPSAGRNWFSAAGSVVVMALTWAAQRTLTTRPVFLASDHGHAAAFPFFFATPNSPGDLVVIW